MSQAILPKVLRAWNWVRNVLFETFFCFCFCLVEATFLYTHNSRKTCCFFCVFLCCFWGKGLQEWSSWVHVGQSPVNKWLIILNIQCFFVVQLCFNRPKRYQQVILPDLSTYVPLQPELVRSWQTKSKLSSSVLEVKLFIHSTNCKQIVSSVIKIGKTL